MKCIGLRKEAVLPLICTVDFTFFLNCRIPFASTTSKMELEVNVLFVMYLVTPFVDFEEVHEEENILGSNAPICKAANTSSELGSFPSKKTCFSDTDTSQTHTSSIESRHPVIVLQVDVTESEAVGLDQSTRNKVCVSFWTCLEIASSSMSFGECTMATLPSLLIFALRVHPLPVQKWSLLEQ